MPLPMLGISNLPVAFSSALYYPYIDIKNERWLRSAALFWDNIRTIVPISHRDPYSNQLARDLCDEGVITPIRVSSDMEEVVELTDDVLEFLTEPSSTGVLFNMDERPGRRIHLDKMSRDMVHQLTHIHPEKLSYYIRSELERGLNDNRWLGVAPGFANFYMTLLATQLAKRLGVGLVTESSTADHLAIAVSKGKPISTSGFGRGGRHFDASGPRRILPNDIQPCLLIDLMVQGISLPPDLSAAKILSFKNAHREELAIFRREVARLASDLPSDVPIEALRQSVSDQYQANVIPALRSLRHSLKANRWDASLTGLLKVSFFSAAPTSAAIMAGFPSSLALLAGAGISLTASAVMQVNKRREIINNNPYSYLLSLERQW